MIKNKKINIQKGGAGNTGNQVFAYNGSRGKVRGFKISIKCQTK
jgi:hypothetical protein